MPGRLQRLRTSLPRGFLPWAFAAACFALLLALAVIRLAAMPAEVTRQANGHQQRVIIDPASGTVSGLAAEGSGEGKAFDVGPDEQEMKAAKPATSAPAEATAAPAGEGDLTALRSTPGSTEWPSVPRADDSLVNPPAPEITEKVGAMLLPKRNEKTGGGASQVYERGFVRGPAAAHLLAIVITDAGFSPDSLSGALALPKDVSIAISPYAPEAGKQIVTLHNAGHEVWAMLPSMGSSYPEDDPGPLGLLTTLSPDQTLERVQNVMAVTLGSVGFVIPPEETISTEPKVWQTMMDEADRRGLLLLQSRPGEPPRQAILHRADIVLDSTPSAAFIKDKLAAIASTASAQPQTIVVASARPLTLALLHDYLAHLPESVTLAPLSELYSQEKIKTGWDEHENLIQRRNK
ncbi:MAG: divergent polysaccharide deacetylase family protein, partial [Alphaproteobacteria bacterium]